MVAHLSHIPCLSNYLIADMSLVGRWSVDLYHYHVRLTYQAPLNLDNHIKAQVERVLWEMDTTHPAAHEDDLDSPFTQEVLVAPVP